MGEQKSVCARHKCIFQFKLNVRAIIKEQHPN